MTKSNKPLIKSTSSASAHELHLQHDLGIYMGKILDIMWRSRKKEVWTGWRVDRSTKDTADRWAKAFMSFHQHIDPTIFDSIFDAESNDLIVQAPIPFVGMCEHHLLPMTGKAAFGYVPDNKVLGLSKISRLVMGVGKEKPSLQE